MCQPRVLYTLCPKKVADQTHVDNFVDFQNSFTAGKGSKFPTKSI